LSEEKIKTSSQAILELMFEAIDANGNGNISKAEFSNFFKSINVKDDKLSDIVFGQIGEYYDN
jgi:Ca2+-binding EF-hand superfamily protein